VLVLILLPEAVDASYTKLKFRSPRADPAELLHPELLRRNQRNRMTNRQRETDRTNHERNTQSAMNPSSSDIPFRLRQQKQPPVVGQTLRRPPQTPGDAVGHCARYESLEKGMVLIRLLPRSLPHKFPQSCQNPSPAELPAVLLCGSKLYACDPVKDNVSTGPPAIQCVPICLNVRYYVGRDRAMHTVCRSILEDDVEQDFIVNFGWKPGA
jgi:hypothetical protein